MSAIRPAPSSCCRQWYLLTPKRVQPHCPFVGVFQPASSLNQDSFKIQTSVLTQLPLTQQTLLAPHLDVGHRGQSAARGLLPPSGLCPLVGQTRANYQSCGTTKRRDGTRTGSVLPGRLRGQEGLLGPVMLEMRCDF